MGIGHHTGDHPRLTIAFSVLASVFVFFVLIFGFPSRLSSSSSSALFSSSQTSLQNFLLPQQPQSIGFSIHGRRARPEISLQQLQRRFRFGGERGGRATPSLVTDGDEKDDDRRVWWNAELLQTQHLNAWPVPPSQRRRLWCFLFYCSSPPSPAAPSPGPAPSPSEVAPAPAPDFSPPPIIGEYEPVPSPSLVASDFSPPPITGVSELAPSPRVGTIEPAPPSLGVVQAPRLAGSRMASSSPSPSALPSNSQSSSFKAIVTAVLVTAAVTLLIAGVIFYFYHKLRRPLNKKNQTNPYSANYDNPLLGTSNRSHMWKYQGDSGTAKESVFKVDDASTWSVISGSSLPPTDSSSDNIRSPKFKAEGRLGLGNPEWSGPGVFRAFSMPASIGKLQTVTTVPWRPVVAAPIAISDLPSTKAATPPRYALPTPLHLPTPSDVSYASEDVSANTTFFSAFGGFWPSSSESSGRSRASSSSEQLLAGVTQSSASHQRSSMALNQPFSATLSSTAASPGERVPAGAFEMSVSTQPSVTATFVATPTKITSFPERLPAPASMFSVSQQLPSMTAHPPVSATLSTTKPALSSAPSLYAVEAFSSVGQKNHPPAPSLYGGATSSTGSTDLASSYSTEAAQRRSSLQRLPSGPPPAYSFSTAPVPPLPLPPALVSAAILSSKAKLNPASSSGLVPTTSAGKTAFPQPLTYAEPQTHSAFPLTSSLSVLETSKKPSSSGIHDASSFSKAAHSHSLPLPPVGADAFPNEASQPHFSPPLTSLPYHVGNSPPEPLAFLTPASVDEAPLPGELLFSVASQASQAQSSSQLRPTSLNTSVGPEELVFTSVSKVPSSNGAFNAHTLPPHASSLLVNESSPQPPTPLSVVSTALVDEVPQQALPGTEVPSWPPAPLPPPMANTPPPPPPPPPAVPLPALKGPPRPLAPPPPPGAKAPPPPPPPPGAKAPPPPPPPLQATKGPPGPPAAPPPPGTKGPPAPPPAPGTKGPPLPPAPPGSAPRPPLFSKPPQAPQSGANAGPKLKPLHWDKVRADPSHSMVWDKLRTGSFELNENEIEALFGFNNPSKNRQPAGPSVPAKKKGVLDSKRAQNIAIQLRALKVRTQDICDALLEGDGLSIELLEVLVKMSPAQDEQKALLDFGGDESELGPAERFLKAVLQVPNAFQRLEAMKFKASIKDDLSQVQESLQILEAACREVRNNRLFLKLLEAVLKTGNRMNKGTNRGEAEAFKLDTLLKLSDVKSADGKTTLLHFVVEEIIKAEGLRAFRANSESGLSPNMPTTAPGLESQKSEEELKRKGLDVVLGLCTELENVRKASGMDADALKQSVLKLASGLSSIQGRLKTSFQVQAHTSGVFPTEDSFCKNMEQFCSQAEDDVLRSKQELDRVFDLVKQSASYFHGNLKETQPLRLFIIVNDFRSMLEKVCRDLAKPLKMKIRG